MGNQTVEFVELKCLMVSRGLEIDKEVVIMHFEQVDVSITGNSTNLTRFLYPVAGTYKKECMEQDKNYFIANLYLKRHNSLE